MFKELYYFYISKNYRTIDVIRKQKMIIEQARDQIAVTLEELKRTQHQLIESEKMAAFGVMASRMAHEIQNPLNFVNNFSEISEELLDEIGNDCSPDEKTENMKLLDENVRKIAFHGKRAENIVKKLQEHINAGTAHEFFEEDNC
jgi:C4-dicarboxylate-specific signal transduction histidine kinase